MEQLLTHPFSKENKWVLCEDFNAIKNPYNSEKEHRHTYYEIFFVEKGGGSKLVDFVEFPLVDNSCYIVCPRQIHLFKNSHKAKGYVLQFREEAVPSTRLNALLQNVSFESDSAVVFEASAEKLNELLQIFFMIQTFSNKRSKNAHESVLHFLQALLFQLLDMREFSSENVSSDISLLSNDFKLLLEDKFCKSHKVKYYAQELSTTERKIAYATQTHLGLTPLQVIHNRLVLESKRLLLFDNLSNKEIAYKLGFDSPASFSHFIKNKTGITPTALKTEIVEIHK